MDKLDEIRAALRRLDLHLAVGDVDGVAHARLRERILAELDPKTRAKLEALLPPPAIPGEGVLRSKKPLAVTRSARERWSRLLDPGSELLGTWRVVRALDWSPSAVTYQVEELGSGLPRLLVLVGTEAMTAEQRESFRREAMAYLELDNPAILRGHQLLEDAEQGLAMLSMEWVPACSAYELCIRARTIPELVPVELALRILAQSLKGLAAAHAGGLVHGAVNPRSILLAGGSDSELLSQPDADPRVKLCGFLVRQPLEPVDDPSGGQGREARAYAAPETLAGSLGATPVADVYGAGAVAYELLSGKAPTAAGHVPVGELRRGVPLWGARVIGEVVERNPVDRADVARAAAELEDELAPAAAPKAAAATAAGPPQATDAAYVEAQTELSEDDLRVVRAVEEFRQLRLAEEVTGRRRRHLAAAAGGAVAVALLVLLGQVLGRSRPRAEPEPSLTAPAVAEQPTPALSMAASRGADAADHSLAAGEAVLVVRSNRAGDTVWLDGLAVGTTLHVVRVAAGRHQLRVTRDGCEPREQWVEVAAGEREGLSFQLVCPTPVPPRPVTAAVWSEPVTGLFFRYIPPGSFTMGSPADEPERMADETPHQVTITRAFWLGDAEVTQGQWSVVMGSNPARATDCGRDCPVEQVTWRDALVFANAASRLAGLSECYRLDGDQASFLGLDCQGLRLPTEAEWEYAARAGTGTAFWCGPTLGPEHANFDGQRAYAGAAPGVFPSQLMPVRSHLPNPWGLYDVHGNVSELVWDAHASYPGAPLVDPVGSGQGAVRMFRGGGWTDPASKCRSAVRGQGSPQYSYGDLGLRLARTAR